MADRSEDILEELKNISFLLGDLNAIRNGAYDPPSGSGSGGVRAGSQATLDDIVSKLDDVVELLGDIAADIRVVRGAV